MAQQHCDEGWGAHQCRLEQRKEVTCLQKSEDKVVMTEDACAETEFKMPLAGVYHLESPLAHY